MIEKVSTRCCCYFVVAFFSHSMYLLYLYVDFMILITFLCYFFSFAIWLRASEHTMNFMEIAFNSTWNVFAFYLFHFENFYLVDVEYGYDY